jgi:tetratricopeptide (TPR) repeat protein
LAEIQGAKPELIFTLHLVLGKLFLDASLCESAARHLSVAAKNGGTYVYPLALCMAKSGDVDGGYSLLLDEIDLMPSAMPVLLPAVLVLLAQVQPSEAVYERIDALMERIENGERLKQPTAKSPEMITALADYWIVRGKPQRAIPLYESCLVQGNLDETRTFVFQKNLAMLYSQVLGEHTKALEVVNNALETRKDNVILLDTKGLVLLNANKPEKATPVLQQAVVLSCELPIYCMHLAYALHQEGRSVPARRNFEKARDALIPLVPNMTKENKVMYDTLHSQYLPEGSQPE